MTQLPKPTLKQWLYSFLGVLTRFRVAGDSMLPTLKAGDLVLADTRAFKTDAPQLEDVVLAQHPKKTGLVIIKRVKSVDANRHIFLQSDNPKGSDSRQFGALPPSMIIAKVIAHSSL